MVSAFFSYTSVMRDQEKRLNYVSKQPIIVRETEYFKNNIGKIKTVDDFINDQRIFTYAMKAYGLSDLSYAKGMMKKILTDEAYAAGLVDIRFQEFRSAFCNELGNFETDPFEVIDRYNHINLEEDLGEQNAGARIALYFKRRIGELEESGRLSNTSWAYSLLADKAIAELVHTALGIPANAPIEAQKQILEQKFSLEKVKNPEECEKLVSRFLAMYDVQHESSQSPALSLLEDTVNSSGSGNQLSSSTLVTLQNIRSGITK